MPVNGAPEIMACPFCAEEIQPKAVFCRYCGKRIKGRWIRRILPLILLIAILSFMYINARHVKGFIIFFRSWGEDFRGIIRSLRDIIEEMKSGLAVLKDYRARP